MNPRLKLRLLKASKVIVKVASVGMLATGVASWGMQFLPPEIYQEIVDVISTSQQAITTYSISSSSIGAGLLLAMQGLKVVNSSLQETDLKIQAIETNFKKQINSELTVHAALDERVLDAVNTEIAYQKKLKKQNDTIIGFQVITAQRNLTLADDLVPVEQKELYKKWLADLGEIDFDITPITKVIELKEIREKIIEVPVKNGKSSTSW
jgi:hypothetical protein